LANFPPFYRAATCERFVPRCRRRRRRRLEMLSILEMPAISRAIKGAREIERVQFSSIIIAAAMRDR